MVNNHAELLPQPYHSSHPPSQKSRNEDLPAKFLRMNVGPPCFLFSMLNVAAGFGMFTAFLITKKFCRPSFGFGRLLKARLNFLGGSVSEFFCREILRLQFVFWPKLPPDCTTFSKRTSSFCVTCKISRGFSWRSECNPGNCNKIWESLNHQPANGASQKLSELQDDFGRNIFRMEIGETLFFD